MKRWIIAISAALLLILIAFFLYVGLRPPEDSVTPQEITNRLESCYMQVDTKGGYCEIEGCTELAALFCTESWDKISYSAEEPVLILTFAEEYCLYLYENGVVQAHDGYARLERNGTVYYETTVDCQAILDYIAVHGERENFRLRWQR